MPFIKHDLVYPKFECTSPEHNPPMHIHLEPGTHIWACPKCGKQTTINIPLVTCDYNPLSEDKMWCSKQQIDAPDWDIMIIT